MLVFTAGQSSGDTQCAEITIPDDSYPQGERRFNVSIGEGVGTIDGDGQGNDSGMGGGRGGTREGGGVRTNPDMSSVTVDIAIDINDRKLRYSLYSVHS